MKQTLPPHPGAVLKARIDDHGLSGRRLAKSLRVIPARLNEIMRGRRGMTAETALLLAGYFPEPPEFWLDLQRDFDLAQARKAMKARKRA